MSLTSERRNEMRAAVDRTAHGIDSHEAKEQNNESNNNNKRRTNRGPF